MLKARNETLKEERRFFKKGDILIYAILIIIFAILVFQSTKFENIKGTTAEIYVDNELKYIYPLQEEEKNIFVQTNIGGVNIKIKNKKIRVITSNSPLKLNVKQVIIGIPDRLLIKITGTIDEDETDVDFIIK